MTPYTKEGKFKLSPQFLEGYARRTPPFGFNGLGLLVYLRSYSRNDGGDNERWHQTVARVVEGTYEQQRRHVEGLRLGWIPQKAQFSAQEMYERMFSMKFLPPGRGLWAMGSPITEERNLAAALNNCAFISTANLKQDPARPFAFLMDMSMLGVGVGFDVLGAGTVTVRGCADGEPEPVVIADSREGWVDSLCRQLLAWLHGERKPLFDYSRIRPAGVPIRGFGGISGGPQPLQDMHRLIEKTLAPLRGKAITATAIVDVMNIIGRCVVSGNVRRTAEIVFGPHDAEEYLDLKDYRKNPRREEFGWTSNNSVFAPLGMDYRAAAERTRHNGEPGYIWLENMRAFSRLGDAPDHKDHRAAGANPCCEQTLESYETCCLVELFPFRHESKEDFLRTIKFAYLYAKTVTLLPTHWPETNRVMLRNRRIGCSLSGIQQFVAKHGIHTLREWARDGYAELRRWDRIYADWLAVPQSVKMSSVKPSGSVSLLAGATPGIHWPVARFVIRRVRLPKGSPLTRLLAEHGYHLEPAAEDREHAVVAEFPVDYGEGVRAEHEVSMWEQLAMAAFMQREWADNQVSATVTFDPEREGPQIAHALDHYQYQLKGISFLPRHAGGAFKQMPVEAISESEYRRRLAKVKPFTQGRHFAHHDTVTEQFCDGDTCQLPSAGTPAREKKGKK
ncbi:MAG TPA: fused protease/ribonucleoside-triphosphate reductase [bacterium]|nr:fused protease/ribonucleoside-triphosphate reductase [bacterium]